MGRTPSLTLKTDKTTGRFFVRVDNRKIYFSGLHAASDPAATREAEAKYYKWRAEYAKAKAANPAAVPLVKKSSTHITMLDLFPQYLDSLEQAAAANKITKQRVSKIRRWLRTIAEHFKQTPISQITVGNLRDFRDKYANSHHPQTANELMRAVTNAYRYGFEHELIAYEDTHKPTIITPLKKPARRPKPLASFKDQFVPVLAKVTKPVATILKVCLYSGMRVGEACQLKTAMISKLPSGSHVATIARHKTERYGKDRVVLLSTKTMEVLQPWLKPDRPNELLFIPADSPTARKRRLDSARRERYRASIEGRSPRLPGRSYDKDSVGLAVRRACDGLKIKRWHVHQLRHMFLTLVRSKGGLEMASLAAGHSDTRTTRIYAGESEQEFQRLADTLNGGFADAVENFNDGK